MAATIAQARRECAETKKILTQAAKLKRAKASEDVRQWLLRERSAADARCKRKIEAIKSGKSVAPKRRKKKAAKKVVKSTTVNATPKPAKKKRAAPKRKKAAKRAAKKR